MATRALLSTFRDGRAVGTRHLVSPGSLLLAAALPLILLHADAQPHVALPVGGADADLSDLAVLSVAVAALVSGIRDGFAPLRTTARLWIAPAVLLVWIAFSIVYAGTTRDWYPTLRHAVTGAKFAEYAVLAPALPLLLRRPRDLVAPAVALAVWSVCASGFGLAQFFGLVRDWDRTPAGWRKESFLGYHDFAAVSGAALSVTLAALALGVDVRRHRHAAAVLTAAGVVGMIVAGTMDGLLGLVLAAAALLVIGRLRRTLTRRRAVAIATVVAVAAAGVVLMRGSTIDQTFRFLGFKHKQQATTSDIQSWPQRFLLLYIGGRVWLDHPIAGVGWQGSFDPPAYRPYLAAAHRRFDQPAAAFPSERHPWGVQNAFVQAAADLGVLGLLAFVAVLVTGLVAATRVAVRAGVSAAWPAAVACASILLVAGIWNALGLIAGIPTEAITWLGLGLAATAHVLEKAS